MPARCRLRPSRPCSALNSTSGFCALISARNFGGSRPTSMVRNLIAGLGQRGRAVLAAVERDIPLRRRTAHQDRNPLHAFLSVQVVAGRAIAAGRPMRLISHGQLDAGLRPCTPARHLLTQRLQIGGGGGAGVDQEVAVLLRNHAHRRASGRGSRLRRSAPTALWPRRVGEGASRRCVRLSGWLSSRCRSGSRRCAPGSPGGSSGCARQLGRR